MSNQISHILIAIDKNEAQKVRMKFDLIFMIFLIRSLSLGSNNVAMELGWGAMTVGSDTILKFHASPTPVIRFQRAIFQMQEF